MKKLSLGGFVFWILGIFASAAASVRLFELLLEGQLSGALSFIVEAYSRFWKDVFLVLEYPISFFVGILSWAFGMQFSFLEASQQVFVLIIMFCISVLSGYRLLPYLHQVLVGDIHIDFCCNTIFVVTKFRNQLWKELALCSGTARRRVSLLYRATCLARDNGSKRLV